MARATNHGTGARVSDGTSKSPEIWRNNSEGILQIKKLGPNGRLEPILVHPGRTFDMTVEERRLNQMEIATPADDPWTNELLGRMDILEGDADVAAHRTPGQLGESEMKDLFAGAIGDLRTAVAGITNPVTLKRLWDLGTASETKPAKLSVVEARVREVDPSAQYLATAPPAPASAPESTGTGGGEPAPPVTPPLGTRAGRP